MSGNDDELFFAYDGSWLATGVHGMMLPLQNRQTMEAFVESEQAEFEQEIIESNSTNTLRKEDADRLFVHLEEGVGDDPEVWGCLLDRVIRPRQLHLADGLVRRAAEGLCPSKIRIRNATEAQWKLIVNFKGQGNQAFGQKDFAKAIDFYHQAIELFPKSMLVAPKVQVEQLVTILSNMAECHLRLKQYLKAGHRATEALVLDNAHEKSRIRRAKASLAIVYDNDESPSYLVQAQQDFQEVLENDPTSDGRKTAKSFLEDLKEVLQMEKKTFAKKHPEADWEDYVQAVQSNCW